MFIDYPEELTADSFMERDIYDEIMSIPDDLDRQLVVGKIRTRAKKLACTQQFDTSLKAIQRDYARYKKEELANSSSFIGANETNFSLRDQAEGQFKCGEWVCDDEGIRLHTDRGLTIVCSHPIYIDKILKNAETGKYKVEIVFKVRGRVQSIYATREVIATPSKILQLANDGIQVTSLTAPLLVKYLSDLEALNPDLIKEQISTSRLGWVEGVDQDGNRVRQFLPYQANVIFDNELNVKSLFDSIKPHGSREKWYKLIKEIRAKRQPEVLINLAASFASVLVEPCGALPFIVSLWGGTGIGKSVVLKICTSVWADPGEGKYITDAKATSTAMEMRLNILNSLPMTLDDMAQVKNQYDEDFSELIYRWCAGKGRDRSNKDLGLNKLTSWRNCTITNGERSLVDESTQGGAINRVIDIEASGEALFDGRSGNKTVKIIEENYGFAGDEFIFQLSNMGFDGINQVYNEYYEKVKEAAANKGVEKEDKQVVPMALILAADYLSEKFLFCDGVRIDIDQAIDYLRNKGEVSEESNAYEYLMDMIAANYFKFEDNEDPGEEEENKRPVERWGFWKNTDTVVINSTIFERIMKQGGFQGKSFLSWAKKHDLLELGEGGRTKKKIKNKVFSGRGVVIKTTYGDPEETAVLGALADEIQEELPFK
jgi:hypothetical protein